MTKAEIRDNARRRISSDTEKAPSAKSGHGEAEGDGHGGAEEQPAH